MITELVTQSIALVVAVLLGFFIRDPLKRWLERRRQIRESTRDRYLIEVISIHADPALDELHSLVARENKRQSLFEFALAERQISISKEETSALTNTSSKREFTEMINSFVSKVRENEEDGGKRASAQSGTRKAIVVTGHPIPGNYYGWNTPGRELLIISTASVKHIINEHRDLSIEDFVVRILQRMAIFSVVPELDPASTHAQYAKGCLFDFTIILDRIVDLLRDPYLCPSCHKLMAKTRGDRFALEAREWVEGKLTGEVSA